MLNRKRWIKLEERSCSKRWEKRMIEMSSKPSQFHFFFPRSSYLQHRHFYFNQSWYAQQSDCYTCLFVPCIGYCCPLLNWSCCSDFEHILLPWGLGWLTKNHQRWIFLLKHSPLVPAWFIFSHAVIFKSGCFVQKYRSGIVTVMRRTADCLDLTKPNLAALDYTAAVRTCGAELCYTVQI